MKLKNINKFCIAFFLIIAITAAGVSAGGEDIKFPEDKNPAGQPFNTVRDTVLSYFYPVSGTVAGLEKGVVRVKFQSDKKLKEGMRFSVFREGQPFYHPVTKEPVGKSEIFIGKVEIKTQVSGETYLCTIIKGTPEPNDIIRITSSMIKLAFFQDKKVDWLISEAFYASVKDTRRFDIIESYAKTYGLKELSEIARARGAEAALMFSTPSKEGTVFLNAKLLWADDAKVFAEIEEPLSPELIKEIKSGDEFISIESTKEIPWISHELVSGQLIAMGDVDGNGRKEIVVSNGTSLRIYDYKDEPKEMWFIQGRADEEHLSVDVLDVNNNGRAEIFVTYLKGEDTINSFVLEYNPLEGYKRIWEKAPYFFRVMGNTLLMQASTRSEIYSGPVYEAVWQDGYYQKGKAVNLPEGVNIYGFTFIDWTGHAGMDKVHQVLAFDDRGYLNLYTAGGGAVPWELIWRSKGSYGGFDISFERKTYSVVNPVEKWFVKGRLITFKTPRGEEVMAVKKNLLIATAPGLGYKNAEFYSLWWDGSRINEELILKNVPRAITDYWLDGENLFFIARSNLSTFLTRALSGELSKSSILYHYRLEK